MSLAKCLVAFALSVGFCVGSPFGEQEKYRDFGNDESSDESYEHIPPSYPTGLDDGPFTPVGKAIQWGPNGKIFLIHNDIKTDYFTATKTCEKWYMRLVRIEDEEKSDTISALLDRYASDGEGPFWMAGNQLKDEEWRWPDGQQIAYFNWAHLEPNNAKGDEMCIELYKDRALWNDENCFLKNGYICETISKSDGKQSDFQSALDSNEITDEKESPRRYPDYQKYVSEKVDLEEQTGDTTEFMLFAAEEENLSGADTTEAILNDVEESPSTDFLYQQFANARFDSNLGVGIVPDSSPIPAVEDIDETDGFTDYFK
ncbi:hypothetical protein NQ317_001981 [Molorchus minor]|uniref:C-type lectin domain-containing protein n=1 Tax=Molorchus minor TaxID=1323400 RepID=A0ABQ9JGX9_9CUCU|nr:hypothetical protein NQ317_001981 [Molorchus minor]